MKTKPTNSHSTHCRFNPLAGRTPLLLLVLALAVFPAGARAATFTVTSSADAGAGSLRQAISNAAAPPGADVITFAPGLSGSTIVLTGGQLLLNKNFTIDASALPGGIRINGNGASRVFNIPTGVTVVLNSLTVTNGLGTAGFLPGNGGGGVYCEGNLVLNNCTFTRNSVPSSTGTISLGGAIAMYHGTLTATNSTFALNSIQAAATAYGGAIVANASTLLFHHCTIVSNTATGGSGGNGGGILSDDGTVQLGRTIVAGNTGSVAADLSGIGGATLTSQGNNLLGNGTGAAAFVHGVNGDQVGTTATPINPLLAPLGNYGGPTTTMRPLPGSPVIDTAATTSLTTDQRGFPRPVDGNGDSIAVADIGAVEYSVPLNVLVIWDINTGGTLTLSNALVNAGCVVTLSSTSETGYNGSNPSPTGFNAVIHLNGTTYGFDMPLAGQIALSNYVANGGGYIQSEWDAYEYGLGRMANMRDLILFDRSNGSGRSVTLTTVPAQAGHPVLAYVPSSFTFTADANIGLAHVFSANPVTVLMTEGANDAVAVRQFGAGRIAGFHHSGNYNVGTLSDANVQQLYINAVNWSAKSVLTVVNNLDSGVGSLRQTVADATTGATIRFAPYLSGSNIVLTGGQVVLDKSLTVDAASLPGGIKIDGNHASRIFQVNGGVTAVLTSLTITNGIDTGGGNDGGGGILSYGTLTLNNCTLSGNAANKAFWGGGGILSYFGTLTINQSTFSGNSANNGTSGGGIVIYGGTLTMNQSTVSGNSANSGGGGIYNSGGALTMNNSIVAGNSPDNISGSFSGTNNLTSGNPLLAPLGNYGGPNPTMLPLPGSPAINVGGVTAFTTDQRGFIRVLGGAPDIGAVESGNTISGYVGIVTTSADTFDGIDTGGVSLREAIALSSPGSIITFSNNLSGSTILLTSGQLLLNKNFTIDASALPGGIIISGNGASRVFYVTNGITVVFNSLTISNGVAPAGYFADGNSGGGIFNRGRLDLLNCTLVRNSVPGAGSAFAGAIANYGGDLRLTNCTLALNSAWVAGAIYSYLGSCALSHCTIASNTASLEIGGVATESAPLSLEHTLLANPAKDLRQTSATITSGGYNLVSDGTGSGLVNGVNGDQVGTTATPINPRLGPLQNNGGPTPTLLLTAGSPALDAGNPLFIGLGLTDQRGFPRVSGGRVDIGAVENCLMLYYPIVSSTVVDVSGSSTAQLQGAGAPLFGFNRFSQGSQSLALNDPVNTQNQYYRIRTGTTNNSVYDLGLTNDFTVSVWVWQRGGATTNGWKVILGLTGAASGPDNPVFGLYSGRMYLSYWGNDVPGNRIIAPSTWNHLAWTYRSHGGQIALYVNGQLDASSVGHAHAPRTADLLVGFSESVAGSYFQGALDDLAIYCEALSPNQIAALAGNTLPDSILPAPALSPGLAASGPCDWSVREIYAHTNDPALMPYDLPSAEYVASSTQFAKTTSYSSSVINRRDPDTNPGGSGFFGGDLPFMSDNLTPQGLINTDDNYFVLAARTTIQVAVEDDYTFGFSTDDGARLRIPGAVFSSSTRLDAGNPANPAHRGDTLSYPGNTGDSRTLGVTHLTPGSYDVEFITWELGGGSFAEVFAARGAKTAVDGTLSLLSPRLFAPQPLLAIQKTSPTQVRVTWTPAGPCDHLQSAPQLAGPWSETGTVNGQIIALLPGQHFFRVAQ